MTENVLQLHKPPPCQDMVAFLRGLANDIEKDKYGVVTTVAVVIGHSSQKLLENGEVEHVEESHTFSAGPRDDLFTVRGLLYTGLASIT